MPPYEKQEESFDQKRKRLASVKVWIENFLDADNKNKNILETFEKNAELELNVEAIGKIDPTTADPINILVLDGGGMKGYAAIATLEALKLNYLEEGQDLFKQFDMIAGTSIGGIYSLFISHYSSLGLDMGQVIEKGRDLMDTVRDNGFAKVDFKRLLCCKQLIDKDSQFLATLKNAGLDIPLKNPNHIPTMVCIAAVKDSKERDEETFQEIEDRELEPLIARTYEYPETENVSKTQPLAFSSSGLQLYEAMAATGAPPVLVDRVRAKVDGKMRIMADGGLFQNCPLALAIDEVGRLYPDRQIGTILNLGYLDYEEQFIYRTLETARLKHPNIHFQRIAANDIMKDFSSIESDIKVIAEMEEKVKDYVINTPRVRNTTFETMKRLFASEPRSFFTSEENNHNEAADKIMADLGKSVGFQQRQRLRASVAKSVLGFRSSSIPTAVHNSSRDTSSLNYMNDRKKTRVHFAEHISPVFESDEVSIVEQFSEDFLALGVRSSSDEYNAVKHNSKSSLENKKTEQEGEAGNVSSQNGTPPDCLESSYAKKVFSDEFSPPTPSNQIEYGNSSRRISTPALDAIRSRKRDIENKYGSQEDGSFSEQMKSASLIQNQNIMEAFAAKDNSRRSLHSNSTQEDKRLERQHTMKLIEVRASHFGEHISPVFESDEDSIVEQFSEESSVEQFSEDFLALGVRSSSDEYIAVKHNSKNLLEKKKTDQEDGPARIVIVVGGPGSGKGILCDRLAKECGVVHLSSGDLLREEVQRDTPLGKEVKGIMARGELVSSAVITALIRRHMRNFPGKLIMLDGFPRSVENASDFLHLMGKPELALHLDCDDTILMERILKRGKEGQAKGEQRADDNIETALQRLRTFHKYHKPTMDWLREQHVPIVNLDCAGTPENVWQQLLTIGRLMRPAASLEGNVEAPLPFLFANENEEEEDNNNEERALSS